MCCILFALCLFCFITEAMLNISRVFDMFIFGPVIYLKLMLLKGDCNGKFILE